MRLPAGQAGIADCGLSNHCHFVTQVISLHLKNPFLTANFHAETAVHAG
jgi:hypothetical protein